MTALETFTRYEQSLASGDMAAFAATLHPEIVWHQPGDNVLSGDHRGPDAVLALLGRFMELSGGTFQLRTVSAMTNGDHVATTVAFSAQRAGHPDLAQNGIDVFRIDGDTIAEVWLFSGDQGVEDSFWS